MVRRFNGGCGAALGRRVDSGSRPGCINGGNRGAVRADAWIMERAHGRPHLRTGGHTGGLEAIWSPRGGRGSFGMAAGWCPGRGGGESRQGRHETAGRLGATPAVVVTPTGQATSAREYGHAGQGRAEPTWTNHTQSEAPATLTEDAASCQKWSASWQQRQGNRRLGRAPGDARPLPRQKNIRKAATAAQVTRRNGRRRTAEPAAQFVSGSCIFQVHLRIPIS